MKNLFLALALVCTINAQESWVVQDSFPTSDPLRSIYFLNPDTGWAVGARSVILKTTNAGMSWTRLPYCATNPLGCPYEFKGVVFPTADTGYVIVNNMIMRSINGGTNLSNVNGVTTNANDTLKSIHCLNKDNCFATGNTGTMLRTTNSETWATSRLSTTAHINSVFFENDSIGWAVGSAGGWYRTTTRGSSWTISTSGGSACNFQSIYINRSTRRVITLLAQFAVGFMPTNGNACYGTTQGYIEIPVQNRLRSVFIPDSVTAWAFGDAGVIKFTNTSGVISYTVIPSPSLALYSGVFTSPNTGFAVGQNGMILKYNPSPVSILRISRNKHNMRLNSYDIIGRNFTHPRYSLKILK
jgi:photosystem II stability/assembly factor-like uncharacterized protein